MARCGLHGIFKVYSQAKTTIVIITLDIFIGNISTRQGAQDVTILLGLCKATDFGAHNIQGTHLAPGWRVANVD